MPSSTTIGYKGERERVVAPWSQSECLFLLDMYELMVVTRCKQFPNNQSWSFDYPTACICGGPVIRG